MTSDAIKQRLSLFQNSFSSAGSNSEDSLRHRFLRPGMGGGGWLISKVSQVYLEAVAELLTVQVSFRVSKHICGVTLDEIVCLSCTCWVGAAPVVHGLPSLCQPSGFRFDWLSPEVWGTNATVTLMLLSVRDSGRGGVHSMNP